MTHPPDGSRRVRSFHRVGRRGAILIAYGSLWVVVGVGTFLGPDQPESVLLHEHSPPTLRGVLWIITGLVALSHAWAPPGRSDAPGFVALYLMPAIRALSYVIAWIDSLDGDGGYNDGWLAALFYIAFMATIVVVAGWREPAPQPVRPVTDLSGGVS